ALALHDHVRREQELAEIVGRSAAAEPVHRLAGAGAHHCLRVERRATLTATPASGRRVLAKCRRADEQRGKCQRETWARVLHTNLHGWAHHCGTPTAES